MTSSARRPHRAARVGLRALLLLAAFAGAGPAATQPELVDLALHDATLLEAVEALARQCQAGVIATPACSDRLAGRITMTVAQAPWDAVVSTLAEVNGLRIALVGDHLEVALVDAPEPGPGLTTVLYDIRTLTQVLPDHHGPGLDLPAARSGSHVGALVEPAKGPEVNEFIDLLQRYVGTASSNGRGAGIAEYNGGIVVTQTPAVQQLMGLALTRLEQRRATQMICRFYRLANPPTATGATLDAGQWAAAAATATLAEAGLVLQGQRQHLASGHERLYVAALDVAQSIHTPTLAALATGVDLDLTPTATGDGVLVDLRLMATVDAQWPQREITDDQGQALGSITTPRLVTDTLSDTRLIPPGGAAIYRCGTRVYALTCEVLQAAGDQRFGPWQADGTIGGKPAPTADPAPGPATGTAPADRGNPGNF